MGSRCSSEDLKPQGSWVDFVQADQLTQLDFKGVVPPDTLVPTIYDKGADLPNVITTIQHKLPMTQENGKLVQMHMKRAPVSLSSEVTSNPNFRPFHSFSSTAER